MHIKANGAHSFHEAFLEHITDLSLFRVHFALVINSLSLEVFQTTLIVTRQFQGL